MLINLFIFLFTFSVTIVYPQTLTIDTILDVKKSTYSNYLFVSEHLVSSLKKGSIDSIVNVYLKQPFGLHDKKSLYENLNWFNEVIGQQNNLSHSEITILNYNLPLSKENEFKIQKISFKYYFIPYGCSNTNNELEIIFSNVLNREFYFEFNFNDCRNLEKIRDNFLSLPKPE